MILLWFTIAPLPSSMLATSPFYSDILGFRDTIDSPHLFPWVPEPMSCQPLWWLVPSLFSHSLLLLMPFPQKLLADFPFWGVSRELTSNLSSFKISTPHLFRFSFLGYLSFCHFSRVIWFHLCQVESFPNYFPSWFFFLGSPRYQPFVHELLVPSSLIPFYIIGRLIKMYLFFVPCVFWAFLLSCLNLIPALLHVLRTPSFWQSLGISA